MVTRKSLSKCHSGHGLNFLRCREMGMSPGLLLKIGMSDLIHLFRG